VDEEGADALVGHLEERYAEHDRRRLERRERLAGAEAITGLVLALASLMGLDSAQLFGQALTYHMSDLRGLAAAPGIAALVAVVGAWLGRRQFTRLEPTWIQPLAAAAVAVGAVALVINVAAFVGLVTASPGGLASG